MPGTIHMDTENVTGCAKKITSQSMSMEDSLISAMNKTKSIPWEGGSSDQFRADANSLQAQFEKSLRDVQVLSTRVEHEVEEWIQIDQKYANEFRNIKNQIPDTSSRHDSSTEHVVTRQELEKQFDSWWGSLSTIEKGVFLQEQHDKICRELGIPPTKIYIADLKDTEILNYTLLDSIGGYDPDQNIIVIDIDNLNNDDPTAMLDVIAHETRHKFQWESAVEWRETGKIPSGVSEDTIKKWAWELDDENYIGGSIWHFKKYWNQAVEVDARAYGADYVEQFVGDGGWQN